MALRPDQIELHSDEVQDILGTPPRWLIRSGTTVVFAVVIILLILSWLVSYPDIVRAPISITTPMPPAPVVSRQAGKISKLFIENGDTIEENTIIGIIENTADEEDVFELEKELDALENLNPSSVLGFEPKKRLKLGDLQTAYSTFTELYEAYEIAVSSKYDVRKIKQINAQIENIQTVNEELINQQETLKEEQQLALNALKRQKTLLADGAAAQQNVDDADATYLQKKRATENIKLQLLQNKLSVNDLERQITTIKKGIKNTSSSNFVSVSESIKQLQTQIQNWKKNFVLTAPVAGMVSYNPGVKVQQFVDAKMEIATVLPTYTEIIGKADLQMQGSGKVQKGLKVIIKLEGFPFREYGFVRGEVLQKSSLPRDNVYEVEVTLPEGLTTNRGKTLPFEQKIQGIAEIITDNRSILSRIFDQLISVFEETKIQ